MSATTRISLSPSPAFCIKSTTLNTSSLTVPASSQAPSSNPSSSSAPTSFTVPPNTKVFVNIAWDKHVPAPPERSEAAIERAIAGDIALDASDPEDWYVPVIVSEPRQDKDKAGKPSVVFDCIFSSSLKSRSLRSPEFKTFLIELAFQRIEAQWGVQLSRQIGTPNIASKGKLAPRSVLIPSVLLPPPSGPAVSPPASSSSPAVAATLDIGFSAKAAGGTQGKPLIEEIEPPTAAASRSGPASTPTPPKGILNNSSAPTTTPPPLVPDLSWSKTEDGRLRIALSVPHLTRSSIPRTTLDLEPRRLIFTAPAISDSDSDSPAYALDLDLTLPDAEIRKVFEATEQGVEDNKSARQALALKHERELDVDGAKAEWRIAEELLLIYA
ncbi:hypothetical protein BV20DRAFT_975824 [Pilatotrama ljubarskyi]|nr:hypothetical protein BV20DRAFT_975824 [Pilatotrama ljubarskyi]